MFLNKVLQEYIYLMVDDESNPYLPQSILEELNLDTYR